VNGCRAAGWVAAELFAVGVRHGEIGRQLGRQHLQRVEDALLKGASANGFVGEL
jgi:hypothetical protein